jgi:hypothetical protein
LRDAFPSFRTIFAAASTTTGLHSSCNPIFKISKGSTQIEEAISQMVPQMKAETAHIHATLQNQSVGLDKMEDLTSENVM